MHHLAVSEIDRLIAEDYPCGELPADARAIGTQPGRMVFVAQGPMISAGTENADASVRAGGGSLVTSCPYAVEPADVQVTLSPD